MAELAIGISKAAVQLLADKVKSALKEEAELWQMVQRDMVFIQDEFEMMESFLSAADAQCAKNNVASTWVRQVCDLSHQLEDCAEFILHLDTNTDTARSWWAFWPWLLPSCCRPGVVQTLDEAVAEIKLLKSRVEEVSQRNMRYNLTGVGDSAASNPGELMQQTTAAGTFDILNAARNHSSYMDLTKLITNRGMDLQVVSVCGTGGDLGRLSIVRKAYDVSRINNRDFQCYAWVKLTYPFDPHDVINNLVAQFYTNSCQQQEQAGRATIGVHPLSRMEASAFELGNQFKQLVEKHRYLIVLEDVSSMAQWDAMRTYLPDMENGSRILVLTNQLELASLCTGTPYRLSELWQFSDNHSVWVFFKDQSPDNSQGYENYYRKKPSFVREVASDWTSNCFLVGREHEVDKLYEMIRDCHGSETNVLSVCGAAGSGKSSVVETVYKRYVAEKKNNSMMFDKLGWVNVSHPLDPLDFLQRLILDMDVQRQPIPFDRTNSISEERLPRRAISEGREFLHGSSRRLIVIDGLQSKNDWDLILGSMPCKVSRTCIVVVTTEDNVATHCAMSPDCVCNIKPLEYDVALDLFRKIFPFETSLNEDMIKEVKSLLSKCGGLPKQIIALASYLGPLANQPRVIQERERERLTEDFMHELTMAKSDSFQSIFAWMRSRYEACPQLIKRCIFYLSIFPENSNIRRRRLVRRWMAEGYSKAIGSNSLEEDVEKLFDKIAALGMIQIQQARRSAAMADVVIRPGQWQVNYLFLEYIISWQKENRVFLPLEVSVLDGGCSLTSGRIGQHLSIGKSWGRGDEFVFHSLDFSRLRSLTVSGEWRPFFISDKMRVLRVLDLEGSSHVRNGDLEQIGEMLPRLKFLSLRGCREVSRLPVALGDLRQLQTLDIRHTRVIELPRSIIKLHNLQYVRASHDDAPSMMDDDGVMALDSGTRDNQSRRRLCTRVYRCFKARRQGQFPERCGVTMPIGIGRLTALRKLGVVDVTTAGAEVTLAELHDLKQLKTLHVSGVPGTKEANTFLSCSVTKSWNFRFPQNLMKLKLDMPKYFLRREDIQAIVKLENLRTLRLSVEEIHGGLPSFLRCMHERDGAAQDQLKIFDVSIDSMRAILYYGAAFEQHKLTLKTTVTLTDVEIQDLGELKGLHTLCLRFELNPFSEDGFQHDQVRQLLFAAAGVQETTCNMFRPMTTTDSFGELKTLEIAIDCNAKLIVKFAQGAMNKLELLKVDCLTRRSDLHLSGLECLLSLKEVWLQGFFGYQLREDMQRQLDRHPSRLVLNISEARAVTTTLSS